MTTLFAGIICILVGIGLLIFAVYGRKKYLAKRERCTAKVDGRIVRLAEKVHSRDSDDYPTSFETYYYPIYEYFVAGQKYEVQSANGKSKADQSLIGQTKQICYNPNNCAESYVNGENANLAFNIAKILGIILVVAGLINILMYFFV